MKSKALSKHLQIHSLVSWQLVLLLLLPYCCSCTAKQARLVAKKKCIPRFMTQYYQVTHAKATSPKNDPVTAALKAVWLTSGQSVFATAILPSICDGECWIWGQGSEAAEPRLDSDSKATKKAFQTHFFRWQKLSDRREHRRQPELERRLLHKVGHPQDYLQRRRRLLQAPPSGFVCMINI